jgi:hypothetical protein
MDREEFNKRTRGLESNTAEYKHYHKLHEAYLAKETKVFNKRQAMIKRFDELSQDVKQGLQISKIKRLTDKGLEETGKALKALHDIMKKNELIQSDRTSDKWT